MAKTYGYIRVSSTDQNEIRQRIALEQQGIPSGHIFMDKMSGKDFQLQKYRYIQTLMYKNDDLCYYFNIFYFKELNSVVKL